MKKILFAIFFFVISSTAVFAVLPSIDNIIGTTEISSEYKNKFDLFLTDEKYDSQQLQISDTVQSYVYSIEDIVNKSFALNNELMKDKLESQIELAGYYVERAEYLPKLKLELGYSKDSTGDISASTAGLGGQQQASTPIGFGTGCNVSFISEYTIWDGGYSSTKAKQKKSTAKLKDANYKLDKFEFQYEVLKSYFDYILFDELVKIRKNMLDYNQENLRFVISQINKGVEIKSSVFNAENELKQAQYDFENELRNLELSRAILNSYIGLTPESPIIARQRFFEPPKTLDYQINDLLTIGLSNRPELKQIDIQKEIAGLDNKMAQARYYKPKIKTNAMYGYLNSDHYSLSEKDKEWKLKLAVELNIFEGWKDKKLIEQSDIAIKKYDAEKKHYEFQIQLEIRRMLNDFIESKNNAELFNDKINQNTEELKIQRVNYDKGILLYKDYLASQKNLLINRLKYTQSLYNFTISVLNLKKSLGLNYNIEIKSK
ncbi:TolC family protein [Candidatus Dependentiae bacterium]|nr:TolC family protein [Candidatus Dependentiae bacterium]